MAKTRSSNRFREAEDVATVNESPAGETPDDGDSSTVVVARKRGFGGCFLKLFLLLLLVVIGLGIAWYVTRTGAQSRLDDRLDSLSEAGMPVSAEQIRDQYSIPSGSLDTTDQWLSVVREFNSRRYTELAGDVILVAKRGMPSWPPKQWKDFEKARELVKAFQLPLIDLQLATAGCAVFHDDIIGDATLSSETLNGLRRGFDFLELSCYVAAHNRDHKELVAGIGACLLYSSCLEAHPEYQIERMHLESRGLKVLLSALARIEFDVDDLVHFKNLIQHRDYWQPISDYWHYQQGLRLMMYTDVDAFRSSALGKSMEANPESDEFFEKLDYNLHYSPFTGDDAQRFLDLMAQVEEQFEGDLFAAAVRIAETEETIASETPTGWARYKQPTARFLVPGISNLVEESGHVAAVRNVALAVLAVDRDRVLHQRFTASVSAAANDFLDEVPMDLYTGNPIIVRPVRQDLAIMSTGPNKADNKLGHDDIGVKLPLEKWKMVEGNARALD